MKLEGDYLFEANVPEVWSALFDPVILAAVMPGCEKLDLVDGSYVGDIKVKVGPIQGKFTGKVDLQDKVEPRSYTMIVDGRGAPGFVKATAHVRLSAEGEATRVNYDTDAQVGGKIASVGQRLIEASARAIVAQSLEGLHTNIKLRAQAHREAAAKQAAAAPAAPPAAEAAPAEAAPAPAEAPAPPLEAAEAAPAPEAARPTEAALVPEAANPVAALEVVRLPEPQVAFTPVKVTQSAVANAVAKEVASSLFPRSVLVAIILIEALVIVLLLLRH
jgi:carbon monoxide dehydrogenase subunit G